MDGGDLLKIEQQEDSTKRGVLQIGIEVHQPSIVDPAQQFKDVSAPRVNPNGVICSFDTTLIPTPTPTVEFPRFHLECSCSHYSPGPVLSLTTGFYGVPSMLCTCGHGWEAHYANLALCVGQSFALGNC